MFISDFLQKQKLQSWIETWIFTNVY